MAKLYSLAFVIPFAILGLFLSNASGQQCNIDLNKPKLVRVGFVTDGATPTDRKLISLYKEHLKQSLRPYYKVSFSKKWTLHGQDSVTGIKKALKRLFSSSGPDVIFALGVVSASQVLSFKNIPKPIIAPYASYYNLAKRIKSQNKKRPGITNFIPIDATYYLDNDLKTFKEIFPFKKCAIILDEREIKGIKGIKDMLHDFGKRHGLEVTLVGATSSAGWTVDKIPKGIQAVFVGSLWHMSDKEKAKLAQLLIQKKIVGFAMWDAKQVELGLLAGLEPNDKQNLLARRASVALLDTLHNNGNIPTIKPSFTRDRELTINMATARQLGLSPNLILLTKATILNEKEEKGRRLNMAKAVQEAVSANLKLQSARVRVQAGEHAVKEKMAELLPRVDIGTGYRAVDQDRAKAGSGLTPERAWTGTAGGTILLYSENKWANYTAEEHLQQARHMNKERIKLDVTYDASVAYLNVLRARTIERIYKENLKLTKANLERAQIKFSTGAAGPDEVYRWQSKFANDRREVLYRESETMDAMEALNRILHRPLDEAFIPEEASLDDPLFIIGDKFYLKLMENPLLLRKFKRFAAQEAVAVRPELKGFDETIKAKARLAKGARRQLWLPDFTVEWKVDQYLSEDGRGRREGTGFDDTDWNVGVFARIPLFEGGKTAARAGRLEQELARLRIDRNAAAEVIIQEVLAAINRTRASYPSITLTREAALAAKKNLDLVTDSYIHGIKTIIDLLDAQGQYLSAELDAANAVYNFLIDFMGVQRAIGEFIIFMPQEKRKYWMDKVNKAIKLK